MRKKVLLVVAFLMLVMLIFAATAEARWAYKDATGQLCYYINVSQSTTGSDSSAWYDVAVLNFSKNQTFWNGTLRTQHIADGKNISQFQFAANSSHVFVFVPVVDSLSAFQLDQYCTYTGDANMSDIREVAPYNLAFDNNISTLTAQNTSPYTIIQNPDGSFNLSSAGIAGFKDTSVPSIQQNMKLWVKMKRINSNTTANSNSSLGAFSSSTAINISGSGIGVYEDNISWGWYDADSNLLAVDNNWHIYQINGTISSGSSDSGIVFDDQYNRQAGTTAAHPSDWGNLAFTYPMYVRNGSAQFDWGIAFDQLTPTWNVFNNTYDFINPNISIISPIWESKIGSSDAALMQVQYLQAFDNCTINIQGAPVLFYSPVAQNQISTDTINNSQIATGENEIKVSCFSGGVESHRYWYFTKEGASAESLFQTAFGFSLSAMGCSNSVITQLNNCTEAYNLTQVYPFAAVVCPNINTTLNYSCIGNGMDNDTKNNFTIFFRPASWDYDHNEAVQHIGADFHFAGIQLPGRFELYSPTQFMYIPAQNKPRDCEIFFSSSSTGCSWWQGFVLNNASVIVSDDKNNWFQTGGTGIEQFNINFSQTVINVNLIQLVNQTGDVFASGIFTRHSCFVNGTSGTFVINMRNTQPQSYVITVLGSSPFTISFMAAALSQEINTTGVTDVFVSNQNGTLCSFNDDSTIFLPFSIPGINIEGHTIIIYIGILFGVILSSITPLALFIPFILNDAYQILNVTQIALIGIFAIVAGFVNNSYANDRGLKHMVMIICIVAAYLVSLSAYQGPLGIDLVGYSGMVTSLTTISNQSSIGDLAVGVASFLVNFFLFIIGIPYNFMQLIYTLLALVSPALHAQLGVFKDFIAVGMTVYFYLKIYEIGRNVFRSV